MITIEILVFDRMDDPRFDCFRSVPGSHISHISKPTLTARSKIFREIEDEPIQRKILKKTFPVSKVPNVVIIFLPQKPTEVFAKKKNFVLEGSLENLLAFLTEDIEDKELDTVHVELSEKREREGDH